MTDHEGNKPYFVRMRQDRTIEVLVYARTGAEAARLAILDGDNTKGKGTVRKGELEVQDVVELP